jgi:hypothetical protein
MLSLLLQIPNNVRDWLLEPTNPSIKYRTLVELFDRSPQDVEVQQTYQEILTWKPIIQIKNAMQSEGFWQVKAEKGKIIGQGTEYRTFNTTHWVLGYLAEYGLTRHEPFIDLAANRYIDLQKQDGDFWQHLSCLYGLNLHTFAKLGFASDPRILKTLGLALASIRQDKGYLCDLHVNKKRKGLPVKSCYRGSVKVLFGLAEYQDIWAHPSTQALIEYFLNRHILFKTNQPTDPVVKNATATVFPFTYREGLLEVLYPLVKMGYGDHPKMAKAWAMLNSKQTPDKNFILDWSPTNRYLKPGDLGQPNKWITFYAYLLYKMKAQTRNIPK